MSVNEKEVQKRKELKGQGSPKFPLGIYSMRQESRTKDTKDENEDSTTSSKEKKKTSNNINGANNNLGNLKDTTDANEDSTTSNNINGANNNLGNLSYEEISGQEKGFYDSLNRGFHCLQDPNNKNHYLLNDLLNK